VRRVAALSPLNQTGRSDRRDLGRGHDYRCSLAGTKPNLRRRVDHLSGIIRRLSPSLPARLAASPFGRRLALTLMPRILVVEDDPVVRLVFEHVLLDAGHEVDAVESVKGAREFLDTLNYDLVLTDGRLPDGIGTAVAERAEELGIPALIITGYAFILRELTTVTPGKYTVLLKPMHPREIVAVVADKLGSHSS
jgi:CheY-like chemotaxis protein